MEIFYLNSFLATLNLVLKHHYSTTDAILFFTGFFRKLIDTKNFVVFCLLHLSLAFDSIDYNHLK